MTKEEIKHEIDWLEKKSSEAKENLKKFDEALNHMMVNGIKDNRFHELLSNRTLCAAGGLCMKIRIEYLTHLMKEKEIIIS